MLPDATLSTIQDIGFKHTTLQVNGQGQAKDYELNFYVSVALNAHLAEGHRARQVLIDPLAELGDDLRVGVRVKRLALFHLCITGTRFGSYTDSQCPIQDSPV